MPVRNVPQGKEGCIEEPSSHESQGCESKFPWWAGIDAIQQSANRKRATLAAAVPLAALYCMKVRPSKA